MTDTHRERTYRSIIEESPWRVLAVLAGVVLLAMLWFDVTGDLTQAGMIGETTMLVLRAPALAAAFIVWFWALHRSLKDIASIVRDYAP